MKNEEQIIKEAAETYARNEWEDLYDSVGITGASRGWETADDFIAGAKWKSERIDKQRTMKAKIITFILFTVLAMGVFYLAGSLVSMSFNVNEWSSTVRTIMSFSFGYIMAVILNDLKEL